MMSKFFEKYMGPKILEMEAYKELVPETYRPVLDAAAQRVFGPAEAIVSELFFEGKLDEWMDQRGFRD